MLNDLASTKTPTDARRLLNKVPEITLYFWIIKVLCTTVGETVADYLNATLGLGLDGTTYVTGGLLVVALIAQFWAKKYIPTLYWIAVVLISIVGTLITDKLTDDLGVPLETTTVLFAVALALTFAVWFAAEKTLSIRTIYTKRREAFYWLTVLVTFALGTAAGDLCLETLKDTLPANQALILSGLFFGAVIAFAAIAHLALKVNAVFAFWIAYIFTRPLGANIGDFLAADKSEGGLALGPEVTSAVFLAAIVASIIYLTVTKKDALPDPH